MKSDKQEVYGEQYGLDLPNRWNDFDPPQQRKYKSLEEESVKKRIDEILHMMAEVRVSEKTIKQFVGCALSRLRIDESIRTEIGKTVYDICQINSSSIDTKDFEPGTLLMKVYDEMYTK
ncbi:DENN domain containing protein [Entamoeba marina]